MTGARERMRTAVCVGAIAMAAAIGATSVSAQQKPVAPAPAPASLGGNPAHGRYLVERVAMCIECHSARDQAGNLLPDQLLHGGSMPIRLPWVTDPPVIVPRIAGLPGYSDAEALRLLTEGAMKRNGVQARAPMPRFHMSHEDAADVIAYLRSK